MKILATGASTLAWAAALAVAGCGGGESGTPAAAAPTAAPSSAAATPAADIAGAETFLRGALARYATAEAYAAHEARERTASDARAALSEAEIAAGSASEQATLATDDAALYTPALTALIRQEGGPGVFPLCMCQDDAGLVVRSLTTAAQADGRVLGTVTYTAGHGPLVFTLESTAAGWRIADVTDQGGGGAGGGPIRLVRTLSAAE